MHPQSESDSVRAPLERSDSSLPWLDRPRSGRSRSPLEQATEGTSAEAPGPLPGVVVGLDEGRPVVRLEESGEEFIVSIVSSVSDEDLRRAIATGQRALVHRGEGGFAVLLGLIRETIETDPTPAEPTSAEPTDPPETLLLEAEKRIEIRCGDSSLVLEENGKVVLRGSYLLSRSTGPNKVKGATIELN